MKILKSVAKLERVQVEATYDNVQMLSGNSKTKEGFSKNLGILRKHGMLESGNSIINLTDQARKIDGVVDTSPYSHDQFWDEIKSSLLTKKGGKIFDELIDGKIHEKETIIDKLGYQQDKLSGFNKDLSKMSTLGYLKKTSTQIQLTDKAFPGGRPGGTTMEI